MTASSALEPIGLNPTKTIADALKTYLTTGQPPPEALGLNRPNLQVVTDFDSDVSF